MISRYAASSRRPRKPTSPTLRMAVSGVRNSCDASAVKRRICSNDDSSRVNVSLKTVASRPEFVARIVDRQSIVQSLGVDRTRAFGHPIDRRECAAGKDIAADTGRSDRRSASRAATCRAIDVDPG